jgi:DNA-binding NtrC family response regulator
MQERKKHDMLREAIIPLSTFSRSAYGVAFTLLPDPQNPGRCSCSLFAAGEPEPEECSAFRQSLFEEGAAVLVRCPAGLTLVAMPVPTGEDERAVLLSEGFLAPGSSIGEDEESFSDGRHTGLAAQRAEEIPKLSSSETDLLVQLMESATVIYPLLNGTEGKAGKPSSSETILSERGSGASLVGISEGVAKIRDALATFAESREPLLVESEQGNGRHLIAALLHRMHSVKEGPFICENLSVLPAPLQEQELFGARGSVPGGGLIEKARGGTLFLNALEHLTPASQRRLFDSLSNDGADESGGRPVARIIASTDRSLSDLVRKGRFRSDLHRRLSRLTLFIPPLRERKEDIPLLAEHFLRSFAGGNGRSLPSLGSETLEALQKYSWPDNVRELQRELQRATAFGKKELDLRDFSPSVQHAARPPQASMTNIREAVGRLETEIISRTLGETKWNKSQAARILGLSRLGLQKKIDRYGLDRRR